MAKRILLKEDGIVNSNSPNGYRFIGYNGLTFSERFGLTTSAIGSALTADLSAEISNRIVGDASLAVELSAQVSYLLGNTDLGSIDSFAEIVSELSNEIARAESVETSIAGGSLIYVTENINPGFESVDITIPSGTFSVNSPLQQGTSTIEIGRAHV